MFRLTNMCQFPIFPILSEDFFENATFYRRSFYKRPGSQHQKYGMPMQP